MAPGNGITRRRFLEAGASVAAAAALGETVSVAAADGPNIVLIVVDTLRADHVYGDRARTPNMDALAREGLRFRQAHPEAMPTVPARNSILSGRRMFPFRGWHDWRGLLESPGWEPLPRSHPAFTTMLRRAGYWTAYVTDNPFLGFSVPYRPLRRSVNFFARTGGQIGGRGSPVSARELRHWVHPAISDGQMRERVRKYVANSHYSHDESRSFAARVCSDAIRALEIGAQRRPFALVVDTYEPHEPWTPPRRYVDLYGDPDHRGPEPGMPRYGRVRTYVPDRLAARLLARMCALYAAEVTMTDRWLGHFLDRLHELQLERETTIVLVGDHGFFLGEHGWTGKIASALHPPLVRVPLIVVDAGRRGSGRKSSFLAQTHDIAPTLLSLAGVRRPRAMSGIDLSPLLAGDRPRKRRFAYGGYGNFLYARTERWKLICDNHGGGRRLYDLARDPGESRNLASRHPGKADALYDAVVRRVGGRPPVYPHR